MAMSVVCGSTSSDAGGPADGVPTVASSDNATLLSADGVPIRSNLDDDARIQGVFLIEDSVEGEACPDARGASPGPPSSGQPRIGEI